MLYRWTTPQTSSTAMRPNNINSYAVVYDAEMTMQEFARLVITSLAVRVRSAAMHVCLFVCKAFVHVHCGCGSGLL